MKLIQVKPTDINEQKDTINEPVFLQVEYKLIGFKSKKVYKYLLQIFIPKPFF